MNIKTKITSFFSEGHERSLLAKKNIAYSFALKAGTILIGFVLIPITIQYISADQYGLWLTLSSIISWMSFFDIGLGNGLKNKLARANALKQFNDSKTFVSTTYALLSVIAVVLMIVFLVVNNFLNWNHILNTSKPINNLNQIVLILFCSFCIQFVVQIINTILTACHLLAKVSVILLIGQIFTLVAVIVLMKYTKSSLLLLVAVNSTIPVVMLILASFWYYKRELKDFSPSFAFVKFKYARELLGVGGAFFFIQMGALILLQTDNIVITQLFGPKQVTVFNIAYKLFSLISVSFTIMLTPLWSAFTDAYTLGELDWIKSIISNMKKLWFYLCIACAVLFASSQILYRVWLHGTVQVPVILSFAMSLYVLGFAWVMLYAYLLNGIGKIRLQVYIYRVCIFVNIPMAIAFGKMFGVAGITFSNFLIFVVMGFLLHLQCKKVLNGTATGVWNR